MAYKNIRKGTTLTVVNPASVPWLQLYDVVLEFERVCKLPMAMRRRQGSAIPASFRPDRDETFIIMGIVQAPRYSVLDGVKKYKVRPLFLWKGKLYTTRKHFDNERAVSRTLRSAFARAETF